MVPIAVCWLFWNIFNQMAINHLTDHFSQIFWGLPGPGLQNDELIHKLIFLTLSWHRISHQ